MKLTYLGHAGFRLEAGGHEVLIDPFLSGCPTAAATPEEFSPSHILLTHGHADHVGDSEAIARRCGATVVSNVEIARWFAAKDVEAMALNIGGSSEFPFGRVRFTPAWHSSSLPDGSYGGMPMGVTVEAEGRRVHHAGDTGLFGDMRLAGRRGLDVALLPIGDHFTMGPEDAVEAARLLGAETVVPMHYDTFEAIEQDAEAFAARLQAETDARCALLAPGGSLEL